MTVSIIIPIYNVEVYLKECLDTVINQTYQDLEIILVDDGSTDNSGKIADEYAINDLRIKVIHKVNSGLSEARNEGMKVATGEWIYFLDSDDWLDLEAINRLVDFAKKNNCDIVQGNFYYKYDDHLLLRKPDKKEINQNILSREEAMKLLIINDRIKNFAWGKLYKRNLIKYILFPKGKFFEDSFWQHLVIDKCSQYGIINIPLYYYRQRNDSISGSPSSRLNDLLEGYKIRLNFILENYPNYYNLMKKKYNQIQNQIFPPKFYKYNPLNFLKKIYTRLLGKNQYIILIK